MSKGNISDLLKTVSLPVMPEVGLDLINTLDDPKTTMARVHGVVARDPTLTAKLLALANSAAFGLTGKVASLDVAIKLVGMGKIRALALSACLHNAFSVPTGIDSGAFWIHCMDSAGYARWLAGGVGKDFEVDLESAWLVGLMLRLGELIIGAARPELVEKLEMQPCEPGERWARERAFAGFDEGEVMAELARRWNFPAHIVHALLLASDPLVQPRVAPLAGVLHLASLLADSPDPDAATIDKLPVAVMSALALKYGWMQSQFPDAASFINIEGLA